MSNGYLRGVYLRLAGVLTLVVLLALLANAAVSHRAFESALAPEMAKKVTSAAASVRALVVRAHESGVPFSELVGVEQRFDEVRKEMPEVSYVVLTDPAGKPMHQRFQPPAGANDYLRSPPVLALLQTPDALPPAVRVGNQYMISLPIVAAGSQALGLLHIGIDVGFVDAIVLDMLYDVLVVLVVSLFFTLELLHFMAGAKLDAGLRALGEVFDRGARGDFSARSAPAGDVAFAGLVRQLELVLARVNSHYEGLVALVEQGRRLPSHERPPGQGIVQAGLAQLAGRFHFGEAPPPVRGNETELAKVRTPLFVFILAEELTRSFLPGYVKELLVPLPWLTTELLVGLPIALFMFIVALGQPVIGVWCERVGHRRTMLTGAAVAAVGFVATALAHNVLDLLLWRSLCAAGYAMVFVAGQAFVLDHATPATRARSFAIFVGAIMAATVCGPSIGGILADNVGVRFTFGISALLAAGSMLAIRGLPDMRPAVGRATARLPKLSEIAALVGNARFMAVTGLAAMPAKILLTGMCFYLVPLYVVSIGDSQAMAGRVLMTYAVAMVVLAPLTAGWATSRERMHWLVGGGLVVSGLGGALMLAGSGVGWVFLAVLLVGLGQSMSISAQSALVSEHCQPEIERLGEGTVYGVYRLLERLGNASGPLLAAVLLRWLGYRFSFAVLGGAVALAGIAFVLATRRSAQPALAPA